LTNQIRWPLLNDVKPSDDARKGYVYVTDYDTVKPKYHLILKTLVGEKRMSYEADLEALKKAVMEGDAEASKKIAEKISSSTLDPVSVIEEKLVPAMKIVGEKFENGEYFLTQLMLAGEAMKAATKILTSKISQEMKDEFKRRKKGIAVTGTVSGDIHDIGKNLLVTLLEVNGFTVYDLGVDVDSMAFIEKAKEVNADIICVSALMTSSLPAQKEVIDFLVAQGLRDNFLIMVGGGLTSKEWAESIGADGWAPTAVEAVRVAEELMERRTHMKEKGAK
jgi:trimethylamine corrinoid protein